MPHRFCAICGKDIDEKAPHFGMCLNCYLKEYPLFQLPDKFSLKVCLDCGSYSLKEEWYESSNPHIFAVVEQAIRQTILKPFLKEDTIEFEISFDNDTLEYSSKDLLKSFDLIIDGTLKKESVITHQKIVRTNLTYDLCKNCVNIRGGLYYLSIVQLRVKNENYFDIIEEALREIHNYVDQLFEKDPRQYITKMQDEKYGVDLFLSTNELMNHIIKILRNNYYFVLKRSKKLVGRDIQRGKNLYRLKCLIKFLPIKKSDIVTIEDKEYVVEHISKKNVLMFDKQGNKLVKEYPYFFNKKITIKRI
ncbi:MAG: NMD3-related protein [Candidatus Hermodarchaeota archaeon]